MTLALSRADWETIVAHVRARRPEEACGLLAGEAGRVQRVYLIENALHSPLEFRMAAAAQVRAMLEIERAGWEVTGIFHSHPAGPPLPSATDVAQAYYPESLNLILYPTPDDTWRGRAFSINAARVVEVPVVVE